MQYCTHVVLVFDRKVGYNMVITLDVFRGGYGRLVTLSQNWMQKNTKLYWNMYNFVV